MKKYVQHISGQGNKWEVLGDQINGWKVRVPEGLAMGAGTWFPKSEYRPCDPPEEWEDVTGECREGETLFHISPVSLITHKSGHLMKNEGFRVRKIDYLHNGPCFIVERKKS